MRTSGCALLLAAIAALAIAAPNAAAQNVTATNEATGSPCPAVTPGDSREFPRDSSVSGGCVLHIRNTEGLFRLFAQIFGVESTDSQCTNEATVRIGANGEGYWTDVDLDGPACSRRPCGTWEGAPEAWKTHIEETTSTTGRAELHFCVENLSSGGGRQTCHIVLPFREDPVGSHTYEMGSASASDIVVEEACEGFTGFRAEITGHWKTELTSVEWVHSL